MLIILNKVNIKLIKNQTDLELSHNVLTLIVIAIFAAAEGEGVTEVVEVVVVFCFLQLCLIHLLHKHTKKDSK